MCDSTLERGECIRYNVVEMDRTRVRVLSAIADSQRTARSSGYMAEWHFTQPSDPHRLPKMRDLFAVVPAASGVSQGLCRNADQQFMSGTHFDAASRV